MNWAARCRLICQKWKQKKQLRQLSPAERREILEKSPYEAGAFQGEGWYIFRKAEPDFEKAHVASLGEVTGDVAEEWIIRRYFEEQAS